jgi:hypothetical protein
MKYVLLIIVQQLKKQPATLEELMERVVISSIAGETQKHMVLATQMIKSSLVNMMPIGLIAVIQVRAIF